jgi:hypothetical protein
VYQVDEVFHGAELHAMNAEIVLALLHLQAPVHEIASRDFILNQT